MKSDLTFVQIRSFILVLLLLSCILLAVGVWFRVHEDINALFVLGLILVPVFALFSVAVLIHYVMSIFAKEKQAEKQAVKQTGHSITQTDATQRHNIPMQKDNIYITVKK